MTRLPDPYADPAFLQKEIDWSAKCFSDYYEQWLAGERNRMVESCMRFWANRYKRLCATLEAL